ncbi:MAG TPA: aromatic amino acid aminotransferase [Sutterella sp.]|nr:aromatic amino acid aminotransferase [Sutterella sp.]
MTAVFENIQAAAPDSILGVTAKYLADPRLEKVNLGVGLYLDEKGKPKVLDVVRQEQKTLIESGLPNTYLPIRGLAAYRELTQKMVFGEHSDVVQSGRACTIQALGGTGAIKLAADFMRNVCGTTVGASSDPTWGNHDDIMRLSGLKVQKYRYYDAAHFGVDFFGMLEDVARLPSGAMPIFHSCCHNPTGYDMTIEQWAELLELCRSHGLVPLLDMAYQGFREGLEADAAAIRLFAESGVDFLVATSYSKSFGLYSERVGALTVVTQSKKQADAVTTRVEALARANYSNPPSFGSRIVAGVLSDSVKRALWEAELATMRDRIRSMRCALAEEMKKIGAKRDFSFITRQSGMFSFTGFSPEQMDRLANEFGIYAVRNGRICICGLNASNVAYVARAFADVL